LFCRSQILSMDDNIEIDNRGIRVHRSRFAIHKL